ncbi:Na(+)/H(+) exchange regulatory cofactor NHE-RF3 isoform X2 [Hyperolius riggenbachi]|uniref:Na(+)/H(+) exchange regulatory cofactor NHE-RF3 isoform X2 n=1 Tax=Hyperolius riggenbachi TaxID=752182 RepID=UPI0035A2D27A
MEMASIATPRECTVTKEDGKGYGFFLRIEQDEIGHLVRSVEKGSSADKAGLKDGDRVIKVNGISVDEKEHPEVVDLIKASGNSVKLVILDEVSYLNSKKNIVDSSANKAPSAGTSSPQPTDPESHQPRLCYVVKDKGTFGFSLKTVKGVSGVYLDNLAPGGAASKAGVQSGDQIMEVNGKNVMLESYDKVVSLVKESGNSIMFLLADKDTVEHFQKTKQRITADKATTVLLQHLPWIVELTKGSDGYGFYLRQEKTRRGHFIVEIEPQGPADKAKLKEFDRIVAVNGQSVEQMTHEQVVEAIRKGGNKTTLLISNDTVDELFAKAGLSPFVHLRELHDPPPAYTEPSKPVEAPKPAVAPSTKPAATPASTPAQPAAPPASLDPKHKPRLCRVKKGDKGFGFNLNALKDVPGQYIKQVVKGGPADVAGVREDDVLVEVSGVNVQMESYESVVGRIKAAGETVTVLVVSPEGNEYYQSQKIQIKASMADPLPEVNSTPKPKQNTPPPSKARAAQEPIELETLSEPEKKEEDKKEEDKKVEDKKEDGKKLEEIQEDKKVEDQKEEAKKEEDDTVL